MKNAFHSLALVTAFAAGFAAHSSSAAIAAEQSSALPTQDEARAALMSQDPGLQNLAINFAPATSAKPDLAPATGAQPAGPETTGRATGDAQPDGPETTGRAAGDALPGRTASPSVQISGGAATVAQGPIGATLQTMPAKFSKRNEILDRVPLMAWPRHMEQDQRQQIYQAIMDDKSPMATNAGDLAPAIGLTLEQADQVRPLPAGLQEMPGLNGLGYLKVKDKVLLVKPAMRVVVDEITQS